MATVNLGRVGFVPKGEYAAATAYEKYDIVSYNGSNYVAQVAVTGVTPGTDDTKWKLFIDNSAAAAATTAANTAASAANTAATNATNATGYIADTYDATKTYAVGDYVIYNGKLYRCNTTISTAEAWTAAHWTETQVVDDVGELKSAVNVVSDLNYPEKTIIHGLFNDQEIQYWQQTAQRIICVECGGNTKYTISKTLGDSFKIGCTASAPAVGVAILGYYSHSENTGNVEYTTPESAQYLLIHCATQSSSATDEQLLADVTIFAITGGKDNVARAEINAISEVVEALDDDVSDLIDDVSSMKAAITVEQYIDKTDTDITPVFTNGYMNTSGVVDDTGSAAYFDHTQKISVQPGDVVTTWRDTKSYTMRFVCAFSGDIPMPSSGSSDEVMQFSVPEGIDGVVVTVRDSANINTIKVTHTEPQNAAYVKPIPMGFMMEQGSLSNGAAMVLPFHNVKNHNIYIFNANVQTFSKIRFSKESSTYIEVDSANLIITNDQNTFTIPHGLTIANNITLMVCNETATSVTLIRVSSNGQEFNYTTATRFIMDSGAPRIESVGSTLTECTFSWVSKNINAPIWLFGDSYFSWYNNRWTYYLARDGYTKDCMLNGYAGEASANAYTALKNLLAVTTPKIVVWCMGMNDGDSTTAVSANWQKYYEKLINLSKKYGFEIVLYTVPTTPVINNQYKDAIIRSSGYRYIEADKAVRIDENGNWIPGALNEGTPENPDNVHPTPMGAKIIYYRVLSDLPEIMCNY